MKHIHAELIETTKKFLTMLEAQKPSDQHLLDDGWIKLRGKPVEHDKTLVILGAVGFTDNPAEVV